MNKNIKGDFQICISVPLKLETRTLYLLFLVNILFYEPNITKWRSIIPSQIFYTISISSVLENFLPLWEIHYVTNKLILIAFLKFYLLDHDFQLTLQQTN